METLEYRKLLALLDGQIEDAKKVADEKAKREALEQHLKLVLHQMESIRSRKEQLDKLGIRPPVDLAGVLAKLEAEKTALEKQLAPPEMQLPPQPPTPAPRLSDADYREMDALYKEIMDIPVGQLEHEERWTQFEIWALRWRIITARAGREVADSDNFLKKVFARIRELMADPSHEQGWFIPALDPERSADWAAHLEACDQKLRKLVEDRRRGEEADQALDTLARDFAIFRTQGEDGNERILRHNIRTAARFEHLRDEVAELLLPMRARLEDEFGFLWKDGKPDEEPAHEPKKLTNLEIVMRIARRMNSKGFIGGVHAPWDKVVKGFPAHDFGRAKEAVDMLVKAGVFRKKNSLIGPRVAIEPGMMFRIEALISGRLAGIPVLDEWCMKDGA